MGRSFCRCWFCSGSAKRLFLVNVIVDESVRLVVTRTSNLYNVISSFISSAAYLPYAALQSRTPIGIRPVQLFFASSSTSTDKHLLLVRPFRSDCWPVIQHVVLVVRPILHMATVAFFLQLWIASIDGTDSCGSHYRCPRALYKEISCLLYLFVLSFYWHSNGTRTPMRVVVRKVNCAWNSYGLCAKLY